MRPSRRVGMVFRGEATDCKAGDRVGNCCVGADWAICTDGDPGWDGSAGRDGKLGGVSSGRAAGGGCDFVGDKGCGTDGGCDCINEDDVR